MAATPISAQIKLIAFYYILEIIKNEKLQLLRFGNNIISYIEVKYRRVRTQNI